MNTIGCEKYSFKILKLNINSNWIFFVYYWLALGLGQHSRMPSVVVRPFWEVLSFLSVTQLCTFVHTTAWPLPASLWGCYSWVLSPIKSTTPAAGQDGYGIGQEVASSWHVVASKTCGLVTELLTPKWGANLLAAFKKAVSPPFSLSVWDEETNEDMKGQKIPSLLCLLSICATTWGRF